ncbi:AEC family transporter [Aquibacillus koreensis]|uniref:AEC family transporter n=1 Tax=Aquibacillus koreensis TaxID=279446 RepID=A0A9X4AK70_9BACI|nr:AEC family transporter [Aquibacillus koreensis]MCT2535270.1 AEC family transporter [Aquibacillus koreensis]MDC3422771.1 AEC family transporter [Aquibacillus koreensis]
MDSFNQQFLYSVIIIALGFILKQSNIIKEKDGEGLARIIFNLTLPALIIVTFNGITIDYSLILLIVIAILYGLLLGFLGIVFFKNEDRTTKGMLAMMVPGFNIGLFAYPLVEGIWGQEGLKYFGMFDVGNAFIVFGLSYLIGTYYAGDNVTFDIKNVVGKLTRSIPLMTYIIVCAISMIGLHLPIAVLDVASIISAANMPMSLLLLGIYLNFSFDKKYMTLTLKYLTLRYVVGLALGLFLFAVLPFDNMFKFTLLIGFILPTSMSVLPYSVEFGYDKKFVGTTSNLTIVISFILIWIMANLIL